MSHILIKKKIYYKNIYRNVNKELFWPSKYIKSSIVLRQCETTKYKRELKNNHQLNNINI